MPRRAVGALGAFGSVLAIAACSGGASSDVVEDSGGIIDCPDDIPATCPPSAPTYAKDIASIVQGSCGSCHAQGGKESSRTLTDYADLFAQRRAVLSQVNACRMPPRSAPPLPAEDRKALLGWLVCGAKND